MPSRKISVFVAHDSVSPVSEKVQSSSLHSHTQLSGFKLGFGVGAGAFIIFFILFLLLRMRNRMWKQNITSTEYPHKLTSFAYRELKMATRGFDNEHKLGQGAFGAVYKGILKGGQEVAVKKLDIASFQGEREFQNELSVIGHVCMSPHIVRLVGFCSNGKKRLLVYEYMHNRSLQEALFDEDYPVQLCWERRFCIIVDACRAVAFLHACTPPIIHGDIKPSNVLLDVRFCAKIADFGLARFKTGSRAECDEDAEAAVYAEKCKLRRQRRCGEKERKQKKDACTVRAVDVERDKNQHQQEPLPTENVRQSVSSSVFTTSPDSDVSSSIVDKPVCDILQSSNDSPVVRHGSVMSDSDLAASASPLPEVDGELLQDKCGCVHIASIAHKPVQENTNMDIGIDSKGVQHEVEKLSASNGKEEKRRGAFGRDWWRQEMSGELSVKDYVMEWMGYNSRRDGSSSLGSAKEASLDGSFQGELIGDVVSNSDKKKGDKCKGRDAWKEGNGSLDASSKSIELKPKDSMSASRKSISLERWRDDATDDSKRRSHKDRPKCREWWKDEEITNSKEWKASKKKREHSLSRDWSGEIFSRGVTSTPSMRGTICYVAPENGSNGVLSEKSDVYSFGVLLLVIISGRRPLQVTASPITEFERANLISWARHLAHSGSVLELVDPSLRGEFCRKQAMLSITVALLCLQRLPSKRPSMNEVLKMLLGEIEAPSLPFHFSPSPPCRVPYRSRRCSLSSEGVTTDSSISS